MRASSIDKNEIKYVQSKELRERTYIAGEQ